MQFLDIYTSRDFQQKQKEARAPIGFLFHTAICAIEENKENNYVFINSKSVNRQEETHFTSNVK